MSAESGFWDWFQEHEEELLHFERDQEAIFDRLARALGEVDEDLTFEFGPLTEGKREFVISAGGLKRAFASVERLHSVRPSLRYFEVIAFRPRRAIVHDIEYGDLQIRASEVYFHLCRDDDPRKIGILLFLPGYGAERETEYQQIGYLMLDEALGEYDVESYVGFIEMVGHDSRHFDGAKPIVDLQGDFDAVREARNGL